MSERATPQKTSVVEPTRELEDIVNVEKADIGQNLQLDKHGFPLNPQPSKWRDDPLNWSASFKFIVLLQVSWLAFLGPLGSGVANPAFVLMSKFFNQTVTVTSYELTVYVLCSGVGPLLIAPLSNVYGRRPIYLAGNALAGLTNVIAGNTDKWSTIMITRAFNGLGAGSTVAIGAATICDMYFMHERGLYMGIYAFFLTNGPHFASLIGGFIAYNLSWQWCFSVPGYMQLGTFVITLFLLPETLYHRHRLSDVGDYQERSTIDLFLFRLQKGETKLTVTDFLKPLYMLRYITITLPGLYYMTCFGYGSIIFSLTGASLFDKYYEFNVAQTGLILSVPLIIGCLIGEFNAGWVTDWMVRRYAKRHDGHVKPEARLNAMWGGLLTPVGIILEGVFLTHYQTVPWVGPAFAMGIASLGLQIATTVVYAYTTDCYKPQSAEIASLLNVFRQVFGAVISFYALPLGNKIQFEYAWLVLGCINIFFFIPMIFVRLYGEKWRKASWQSPPKFHNDI